MARQKKSEILCSHAEFTNTKVRGTHRVCEKRKSEWDVGGAGQHSNLALGWWLVSQIYR